MSATLSPPRLSDLPLWRLVVALHDAEELAGPESESAALIRRAIVDRMRGPVRVAGRPGGDDAA
jgi:hypothetical protein